MASLQHMKQLDGLRGLAIFGVFLAHFLQLPIEHPLFLPYGSIGVRLFFVLSGFLITGVLIKARDRIDAGQQGVGFTLRSFYARRCLRLFVVFYLWLIATQIAFGGQRFWWDALYLSNFYDIFFANGKGNHYWSLAVEEQFYLVWPVLILLLPRKNWGQLFWGCFFGCIAIRVIMAFAGYDYLIVKKFPLTCSDALAGGALIASYTYAKDPWNSKAKSRFTTILGVAGIVFFVIAIASLKMYGEKGLVYTSTLHTGLAMLSMAVLVPAIVGYNGLVGTFLCLGPLRFLGKISYGCYVYHLVIREVVNKGAVAVGLEDYLLATFTIKVLVTVLVAYLSWIFLEARVNSLKKHFPMSKQVVSQL